jgi:hypothetical protein
MHQLPEMHNLPTFRDPGAMDALAVEATHPETAFR